MPRFIEITFLTLSEVTSQLGKKERVYSVTGSPVACTREVIGVTESYQAQAAGFKPTLKIKLREGEYDESFKGFVYNSIQYKIIRTQNASPGFITLVGEAATQ